MAYLFFYEWFHGKPEAEILSALKKKTTALRFNSFYKNLPDLN